MAVGTALGADDLPRVDRAVRVSRRETREATIVAARDAPALGADLVAWSSPELRRGEHRHAGER
jgi:hypothetical protein